MLSAQWHRLPGMPAQVPPNIAIWYVSWHREGNIGIAPDTETCWELVEQHKQQLPLLALISQLCETRPVLVSGGTAVQTWIRGDDRQHAERCPVILATQLLDGSPLQPCTLAQWGERGLIFEGGSLFLYPLDVLDEQDRLLCQQVQDLLGLLAEETDAGGRQDEEIWQEAQQAARHLAECYWNVHQSGDAVSATSGQLTVPGGGGESVEFPGASARRLRTSRHESAALVLRDPIAVQVSADVIVHELMRSLLSSTFYTLFPQHQIAERHLVYPHGDGEMVISIRPGSGEGWEHVLAALETLGDEVVDTFCALLALALDVHGSERITDTLYVNFDDLLAVCNRQRSHRAYLPEQRAAVLKHLLALSRVHVTAAFPGRRPGFEKRVDDAVVYVLSGRIGEYNTSTGEAVWERQAVKLGDWALLTPPHMVLMLRQVLHYHSQKERYEKRLGRYLSLQFRAHMRQGGVVICSMGTLLEQSGIKPELKHPDRTRANIESALTRLQQDGVIGFYKTEEEGIPTSAGTQAQIRERGRGWWQRYEAQLCRIEPPALLLQTYRRKLLPTAKRKGDQVIEGGLLGDARVNGAIVEGE